MCKKRAFYNVEERIFDIGCSSSFITCTSFGSRKSILAMKKSGKRAQVWYIIMIFKYKYSYSRPNKVRWCQKQLCV